MKRLQNNAITSIESDLIDYVEIEDKKASTKVIYWIFDKIWFVAKWLLIFIFKFLIWNTLKFLDKRIFKPFLKAISKGIAYALIIFIVIAIIAVITISLSQGVPFMNAVSIIISKLM